MKAKISKSSNWDYEEEGHFGTLEELVEFVRQNGRVVLDACLEREWVPNPHFNPSKGISSANPKGRYRWVPDTEHLEVEIYDDYRE